MDSIETRLRDAKLGSAIENAAGKLPEDWMLSINIEQGIASVSLLDPFGNDVEIEQSDDIVEDINNAVAEAIAIAKENPLDEFLKDTLGDDAHLFTSDGKNRSST